GLGNQDLDSSDKTDTTKFKNEGICRYFLIGAMVLGILGLIFSLMSRKASSGGILTGILGAAALIAFMITVMKYYKDLIAIQAAKKATEGADIGFGNGNQVVHFAMSIWFYIAVIAFIAGAVF